jgi:hypothetical protein
MTEKAYRLEGNINRLSYMERGDTYDLKSFDFPNSSELHYIYQSRDLELPNPVFFYVYSKPEFIRNLDALYVQNLGYVVSKRVINSLKSVKDFSHRTFPIAILEEGAIKFAENPDGFKTPNPYENPDAFSKKSLRNDMYIIQTLEVLENCFDWEKSVYRQSEFNKRHGQPGLVSEFYLNEPDSGFPPLFRVKESQTTLFVSFEARMALKLAGIKGLAFLSLKGYSPTSQLEIDVPI